MRFEALKRTAIDGKIWWCVYDHEKHEFSGCTCFGKYRTKKSAIWAIEFYTKEWKLK